MSNPLAVLVASLLAAVLAGGVVFYVVQSEPRSAPAGPVTDAAVIERLDALAERLDGIEGRMVARAESAPVRSERAVTRADVQEWIAEAMVERGGAQEEDEAAGGFRVASAVADLVDLGFHGEEGQAIWARARETGKVKELIAAFEVRAQENPNSAEAQADLGDAYVQGIVGANDMLTQSVFGQKADVAYTAALELDDTHWRARFSKATGLTFWPDFLGKKAEAIEHFEILARQQESSAIRPEYQMTWLTLGNVYQQQGKDDEARRAWERGLAQFPDDPQLLEKLGR